MATTMLGLKIPPKVMASGKTLFPHQTEAVFSVMKEAERARQLQVSGRGGRVDTCAVSQPTAAGKSVEFFRLAQEVFEAWGWRTLVICPSTPLVEQLTKTARHELGEEWTVGQIGDDVCEFKGRRLVVAIAAALTGKSGAKRLAEVLAEGFELVIFDEGHHVVSDTWEALLAAFKESAQLVCGFTATIMRGDRKSAVSDRYFKKLVCYHTAGQLVEWGRLTKCYGHVVKTGVEIQNVRMTRGGDYNAEDLDREVNTDALNELAVKAWQTYALDRPTVVFCVSIAHARALAEKFREKGVAAEAVWGKGSRKGREGRPGQKGMPKGERKRIIEGFNAGEVKVITNVYVLNEGFDAPQISAVMLCRPMTKALGAVFFPQACGRAMRLHQGKEYSVIIEMLFGADDDDDDQDATADEPERGRASDIVNGEPAEAAEKKEKKPRSMIASALGLEEDELDETGMLSLDEMERIAKEKQRERERSSLREALMRLDDADAIKKTFEVIARLAYTSTYAWIPLGDKNITMTLGSTGDFIEVVQEDQFRWAVYTSFGERLDLVGYGPTREAALQLADEWLDMQDLNRYLTDRRAAWRELEPTRAQLSVAERLGLNVAMLRKLKRGQVSDLITSARALEKRAPKLPFAPPAAEAPAEVVYDI